ncbi:hypothetical protein P9112_010568 [Eukaryota sp. TZLM1-RC]
MGSTDDTFYARVYLGHYARAVGHEFLEFEIFDNGTILYSNNSKYKNEALIKRELQASPAVISLLRQMVDNSRIVDLDDSLWPFANKIGKTELEIVSGNYHICFETAKQFSLAEIEGSRDPKGLGCFVDLVQELKSLVLNLVHIHFVRNPL